MRFFRDNSQIGFSILFLVSLFAVSSLCQAGNSGALSGLLRDLSARQDYRAGTESSYDRSGGNRDFIVIEPDQTYVLADIKGPGAVTHFWFTAKGEEYYPRKLVLEIFWENSGTPAVSVPIGDFFGAGHGLEIPIKSLPLVSPPPGKGRNCYFYMPFNERALVRVRNEGDEPIPSFFYQLDYRTFKKTNPDIFYFHALYNQQTPTPGWYDFSQAKSGKTLWTDELMEARNTSGEDNYRILELSGNGHYVGCILSVESRDHGAWVEGDHFIRVDGEKKASILGTGTEDYFGGAWGARETNNPYFGCNLHEGEEKGDKTVFYRFHIQDPVPFRQSISVSIEHGHANSRSDYMSSMAYWYQDKPEHPAVPLPPVDERLPAAARGKLAFKELDKVIRSAPNDKTRFDNYISAISRLIDEHPELDKDYVWAARRAHYLMLAGRDNRANEEITSISRKTSLRKEFPGIDVNRRSRELYSVLMTPEKIMIQAWSMGKYDIFWDGMYVGSSLDRNQHKLWRISCTPGRHVLAVSTLGFGDIGAILVQADNKKVTCRTGENWKASDKKYDAWSAVDFDDSGWKDAVMVDPRLSSSWKLPERPGAARKLGLIMAQPVWLDPALDFQETAYFRCIIDIPEDTDE